MPRCGADCVYLAKTNKTKRDKYWPAAKPFTLGRAARRRTRPTRTAAAGRRQVPLPCCRPHRPTVTASGQLPHRPMFHSRGQREPLLAGSPHGSLPKAHKRPGIADGVAVGVALGVAEVFPSALRLMAEAPRAALPLASPLPSFPVVDRECGSWHLAPGHHGHLSSARAIRTASPHDGTGAVDSRESMARPLSTS